MAATQAVPAAPSLAQQQPPHAGSDRSAEAKERIKQLCERNGLEVLEHTAAQCTHGEDPPPPGKNIKRDVKPVATMSASESGAVGSTGQELTPGAPSFICDGDGQSGYRTQVMYVRAAGTPDRYGTYLASFLQWAWEADQIYRGSALDTGGLRRIRFVQGPSCAPTVLNVTLSAAGDDTLSNTINELDAAGYDRSDRKYMIFMDANVLCGVGTMVADDRAGQENWNNIGPDYGRIDAGCWSGDIAAHEHMHTMGGVQNSAPHASGGNHCTDEYDVMCYSDEPNRPAMQVLCSTTNRDWSRFDCNYDDYFNTNPPAGSYLATRWNAANNRFLATDPGTPPPSTCPDQSLEPDETYPAASPITVGTAITRGLCVAGDQDWMSFQANANQRYRVEVMSHAAAITPSLELFAANGVKALASHVPPAGGMAAFEFRARTGGIHYLRAKNITPSYTASSSNVYDMKVSPAAPAGTSVGGFGYNYYNQIGGPPSVVNYTPAVAFNSAAMQVSAGHLHTAAVLGDGTVRTWGWNAYGQLGNGSKVDSATQVNPGLAGVTAVSSGFLHTLALKADGTVWAWGWNGGGQLGDGTTTDRPAPVKVLGLTDIVEISAGWTHNLALKRDGTVWAWGNNAMGSIGYGTMITRKIAVKLPLSKVTSIAAGGYHSLAVLQDGSVKAWGTNEDGQVGDGTRFRRWSPVTVVGLSGVYRVSAGWAHSAALRNDGSVWTWGQNAQQQAGGAPSVGKLVPSPVNCSSDSACPRLGAGLTMGRIVWISSGNGLHNVVEAEDGSVWSWGWNGVGQLGDGTLVNSGTAVKATGLTASDVSAGFYHSSYRS